MGFMGFPGKKIPINPMHPINPSLENVNMPYCTKPGKAIDRLYL